MLILSEVCCTGHFAKKHCFWRTYFVCFFQKFFVSHASAATHTHPPTLVYHPLSYISGYRHVFGARHMLFDQVLDVLEVVLHSMHFSLFWMIVQSIQASLQLQMTSELNR